MAGSSRAVTSVSLRKLFPQAIFTTAEEITVGSCSRIPRLAKQYNEGHLFVAGMDPRSIDDEKATLAVEKGATVILTERLLPVSAPQCLVEDVRAAYAKVQHALARNPSEKILTIGVLGTHGKTTTALMVASMMKRIGGAVAYHTTLGMKPELETKDGSASPSSLSASTSGALTRWLQQAAKSKAPAAVIEISESMLLDRSASGMTFDVLVIPSLRKPQSVSKRVAATIESAIERTLSQLKGHGLVVYNADDARLNRWIDRNQTPAIGYAIDADAQVRGKRISRMHGSQTMMVSAGRSLMPLTTAFSGDHNLRNLLAAVAVGHAFGLDLFEVIGGVESLKSIPGRMQSINCGQSFHVAVDAADQPDRLAVALHALAPLGGPITCVAETPEGMDAQQRAAFGRVLSKAASRVILTQSHQSTTIGQKAMWEVIDGCDNPAAIHVVPDRAAAIELAIRSAQPGEQILLAGWGVQNWTNGREKSVCNDVKLAESILYAMNKEEPLASKAVVLSSIKTPQVNKSNAATPTAPINNIGLKMFRP